MDEDDKERIEEQLAGLHAVNISLKAQITALSAIVEKLSEHSGFKFESGLSFQVYWDRLKRHIIDHVLKKMADDYPAQASRIERILKEDRGHL